MAVNLNGYWKSVNNKDTKADGFNYRLIQVGNKLFVLGYSDGNKVENIGYGHSDSFDVGSIIEIFWVNLTVKYSIPPAEHKIKVKIVDVNTLYVCEVVSGQEKAYGNWKRIYKKN